MKSPSALPLNTRIPFESNSNKRQKEGAVTFSMNLLTTSLRPTPRMTLLPILTASRCVICKHLTSCPRNTPNLIGIWRFYATKQMTNMYSKELLLRGFRNPICHSMRSYWGWKKNATVHDLARHSTSLVKLQLVYELPMLPNTMKRRKSDMEIGDAEAPMQIISIRVRRRRLNSLTRIHHLHHHCSHANKAPTASTPSTAAECATFIFANDFNDVYRWRTSLPLLPIYQPLFHSMHCSSAAGSCHTDQYTQS